MIERVVCRTGMALAAASILMVTVPAHAQKGAEGAARETRTETTLEDTTHPKTEDQEGLREPLFVGLDFMLGFGNYTSAVTANPVPPAFQTTSVLDETQIRTAAFLIIAHYRLKKFGVGFRIPIVSGHIPRDPAIDSQEQDILNFGNVELSADMTHRMSPTMKLVSSVALTLPTSSGNATPYTNQSIADHLATTANPDALTDGYARYAIGMAAAFARGGEDDALFFNWRLGITPKAELKMKFNHTRVEPYLKIPIMFGLEQNSAAEEPLRLELVPGVRVLQEIGPVHLGVRLVAMIPIAARTTLKDPMLSVWPEARLQITPSAQFWLSGMIPLAGDYSVFDNKQNGAVNAGLSATF